MSFLLKWKNLSGKLAFLFSGLFTVLFLSGWVNFDSGLLKDSSETQNRYATAIGGEIISNPSLPPAAPPSGGEGDNGEEPQPEMVDVISNGDFEKRWQPLNGVAPDWEPFHNGQADFGWYDESWVEAVRRGQGHAQLMEIFRVEGNILDRVIAIYQTVEVVPNSDYELTIHAIMRTDAAAQFRNQSEFEMHWGIDPWGEGNYDNVEEWNLIPLTEQNRLGSTDDYPDDTPLFYERITDTVRTADSNRITLFIRGLKKFPTNTEVNFDVDDVSLVGPLTKTAPEPDGPTVIITPGDVPQTGAVLSQSASVGVLVLGGLVFVILGTFATASLLFHKKKG